MQSSEDAEDVLIESFVKIYNSIGKFQNKSSLETWMRRIVINESLNKIRARKSIHETDVYEVPHISFDDKAFDSLHVEEIFHLVQNLPDGYRTVFNMYAIDGYSHKEISEKLGIQEASSRSQLAKARRSLMISMNTLNDYKKTDL
jgi:RNA polymerase sigma factor (sigma-70 family)